MKPRNSITSGENNIPNLLNQLIESWIIIEEDGKRASVTFAYGDWQAFGEYSNGELEKITFRNYNFPDGRIENLIVFIEDGKPTEFNLKKEWLNFSRDNGIRRWDNRKSIWILPELSLTFSADGKIIPRSLELRRGTLAHVELYLRGESYVGWGLQWTINSFGFFSFDQSWRVIKVEGGDIPDLTQNRVSMQYEAQNSEWKSVEMSQWTALSNPETIPQVKYFITLSEQTITVYINDELVDSFYLVPNLPEDIQVLFGLKNTSQIIEWVGGKVESINRDR